MLAFYVVLSPWPEKPPIQARRMAPGVFEYLYANARGEGKVVRLVQDPRNGTWSVAELQL